MLNDWLVQIEADGFVELPGVFSVNQVDSILESFQSAVASAHGRNLLKTGAGEIYGVRNLLSIYPGVFRICSQSPLNELLGAVLGDGFGLVRGLFFDKPPTHSWSLPWHRDLTIAVRDNTLVSAAFRNPTTKVGVPHVEAPQSVLDQMLTLRIHLDDVTAKNGPLKVIAGSHRDERKGDVQDILARRGDVLAMRPRLSHSSIVAESGNQRHRRILHLEYSADLKLPDGFVWHDFIRQ